MGRVAAWGGTLLWCALGCGAPEEGPWAPADEDAQKRPDRPGDEGGGERTDAGPTGGGPTRTTPDAGGDVVEPCPADDFADEGVRTWDWEEVESPGGQYSSIAIAPDGRIHITYLDKENHSLRHAWGTKGDWNSELVDADHAGSWTSTEIDALGRVHVAYSTTIDPELRYALYSGGSWTVETITEIGNAGPYASLALDADGEPHVAFYFASRHDLGYATHESGEWVVETVDWIGLTGANASLALDDAGAAHVAYEDIGIGHVRYATNETGSWLTETLAEDASHPTLAIDIEGRIHVAYQALRDVAVRHLYRACGAWTDPTDVHVGEELGDTLFLAASPQGSMQIVFDDSPGWGIAGDLRHGVWTGGWSDWAIGTAGLYPSMVVDDDGTAHVSYYSLGSNSLRYASGTR